MSDEKEPSKRSEGQKIYQNFLDAYRKAHPNLKKITQYERANEEWSKIKNNENLRNQRMVELNAQAQSSKASAKTNFLALFSKAKKPDKNKPSTSAATVIPENEEYVLKSFFPIFLVKNSWMLFGLQSLLIACLYCCKRIK